MMEMMEKLVFWIVLIGIIVFLIYDIFIRNTTTSGKKISKISFKNLKIFLQKVLRVCFLTVMAVVGCNLLSRFGTVSGFVGLIVGLILGIVIIHYISSEWQHMKWYYKTLFIILTILGLIASILS